MYTHTSKCVHTYIQTHTPTDFLNDIDTQIVLSHTLTLYTTHQTFTHSNTLHYTPDFHTHTRTHTHTHTHTPFSTLQGVPSVIAIATAHYGSPSCSLLLSSAQACQCPHTHTAAHGHRTHTCRRQAQNTHTAVNGHRIHTLLQLQTGTDHTQFFQQAQNTHTSASGHRPHTLLPTSTKHTHFCRRAQNTHSLQTGTEHTLTAAH